ncbi:MAG: phosphoribosylglycinamide formyltransferase [Xanthobacteraceae bacterium]
MADAQAAQRPVDKKRVAVLISGRGSNMAALIEAANTKDYPAEIVLVVSNTPDASGLARAREAGIPTAVVDHRPFGADRDAFERVLDAQLKAHRADLVCLAGFMRLLTPSFVRRWGGRMLNIHPALLPQFKGLHTHRRALDAGVERHGATVHFVIPEMDSGPIIAQDSVSVLEGDTEESLAQRVLEVEHRLYPQALRMVAEGRIALPGSSAEAPRLEGHSTNKNPQTAPAGWPKSDCPSSKPQE